MNESDSAKAHAQRETDVVEIVSKHAPRVNLSDLLRMAWECGFDFLKTEIDSQRERGDQ